MIPIPEVVQRRHRVVIGVDTHKYVHVAVALDEFGGVIDAQRFAADRAGYTLLIDWAAGLGRQLTFAIEGTGSSGAGLTAAVRRRDISVIEVLRTDRRDRGLRGTNDTLDAENAARAVLGGQATADPKTNDGVVEMLRQIKVVKDVAVKARTAAMISLQAVLVNAPPELRETLQPLSKMALIAAPGCAPARSPPWPRRPNTPCARSPAAGSNSMRRSRPTRRCSPSSPAGSWRSWSRPSASARTPPRSCSSSPGTTSTGSAPRPRGPGSAESPRSRLLPV